MYVALHCLLQHGSIVGRNEEDRKKSQRSDSKYGFSPHSNYGYPPRPPPQGGGPSHLVNGEHSPKVENGDSGGTVGIPSTNSPTGGFMSSASYTPPYSRVSAPLSIPPTSTAHSHSKMSPHSPHRGMQHSPYASPPPAGGRSPSKNYPLHNGYHQSSPPPPPLYNGHLPPPPPTSPHQQPDVPPKVNRATKPTRLKPGSHDPPLPESGPVNNVADNNYINAGSSLERQNKVKILHILL